MRSESVRIPTTSGLLAGQIFYGRESAPAPAILLESSLAATHDALTQATALALRARGWTVLTFDHAGFGNSGGGNRSNRSSKGGLGSLSGIGLNAGFSLKRQTDDLTRVWWWLRKRIGIDGNRVGIWAHGLGGWRARLLLERNPDLQALVLHQPLWRQRDWLLSPTTGFTLLQAAGYFADSEPDPLSNPQWTLAWLDLLRAPLPKPKRLPDSPVLLWKSADEPAQRYAAMGKGSKTEEATLPGQVTRALTLPDQADPVMHETDGFFRQYL